MVQYQEIKESTKLNIQRLSYLITDITEPREKLKKKLIFISDDSATYTQTCDGAVDKRRL